MLLIVFFERYVVSCGHTIPFTKRNLIFYMKIAPMRKRNNRFLCFNGSRKKWPSNERINWDNFSSGFLILRRTITRLASVKQRLQLFHATLFNIVECSRLSTFGHRVEVEWCWFNCFFFFRWDKPVKFFWPPCSASYNKVVINNVERFKNPFKRGLTEISWRVIR